MATALGKAPAKAPCTAETGPAGIEAEERAVRDPFFRTLLLLYFFVLTIIGKDNILL